MGLGLSNFWFCLFFSGRGQKKRRPVKQQNVNKSSSIPVGSLLHTHFLPAAAPSCIIPAPCSLLTPVFQLSVHPHDLLCYQWRRPQLCLVSRQSAVQYSVQCLSIVCAVQCAVAVQLCTVTVQCLSQTPPPLILCHLQLPVGPTIAQFSGRICLH